VTAQPTIGVLAVQGDVREHLHVLEEAGARATPLRRPSELEAVDGLVIPGGESTTIDKLVRAFDLFDPLRARLEAGLPAYGSCAGMIMLADRIADGRPDQQTLGGIDMTVRRNAFGRQVDSWEGDIDFEGIEGGKPLHGVFIRAPWVEDCGADVEVLARAVDRIVAVRQGPLLATAFHPELTSDTRVHALFVSIVEESPL